MMRALTVADRDRILALGQGQLGTSERPAKSNRTPYGAWYGLDGNAWCAMFVSWCYHQALGFSPFPAQTGKGFAYCPSGANWFKANNLWAPNTTAPKPGWVVFFDFPKDDVNRISHVGIVTSALRDGRVATLEGNTNARGSRTGGSVMTHQRSRAGGIIGYGTLSFGGSGGGGGGGGAPADPNALPVLAAALAPNSRANDRAHVEALQRRLNVAIKRLASAKPAPPPPLKVDGDFGENTDAAVRWYKTTTNAAMVAFKKPAPFEQPITGLAGPKLFASLWFWTS